MVNLRRHGLAFGMCGWITVTVLAVVLSPTVFPEEALQHAYAQTEEPQPLDPYVYTHIKALREEIALTTRDLAAMGCTQESATILLESLKTWHDAHADTLAQLERNEMNIRATLRDVARGNVDLADSAVAELQQSLADLYESRKATISDLVSRLETSMSTQQRSIWKAARENAGLPDQVRYAPGLTDAQRQTIRSLATRRVKDSISRENLYGCLDLAQKQSIDVARANSEAGLQLIRIAEAIVLPNPQD